MKTICSWQALKKIFNFFFLFKIFAVLVLTLHPFSSIFHYSQNVDETLGVCAGSQYINNI